MTNNIDVMKWYMKDLGIPTEQKYRNDLYFDVQLIRRGKDNPDLPAANYTFKTYYIDSIELFDNYIEEIKTCCNLFRLRAYISVNAKSKLELSKKTLVKYSEMVSLNEFKKPWRFCDHVNGSLSGKEKRWVVDVDDCNNTDKYFLTVCDNINKCTSKYENPIVMILPTKTGNHIITHPFNTYEFEKKCKECEIETPGIKKNHITLLYENL
jgi:hypothetical protein